MIKKLMFVLYIFILCIPINLTCQTTKIPKIMHTLWLGKSFPAQFHMYKLIWAKKHPQWTHILWVDDQCNYSYGYLLENPNLKDISDGKYAGKLLIIDVKTLKLHENMMYKQGNYNEKSDIARNMIIDLLGGAYINADCDCIKPFDELHELYDFYVGQSEFEGRIFFSNAIFGAVPGNPIIKHCLVNCLTGKKGLTIGSFAANQTFLQLLRNSQKNGILPATYFYPLSPNQKDANGPEISNHIKPETMCVCHWQERCYDHSSQQSKHVIGLHNGQEGLFSLLKGTIHHLAYCMRYNKTPVVFWNDSSSYYQPEGYHGSTNVWEYYFEPVSNLRYEHTDYIWYLYGAPDNTGIDIEALSSREKSFRKMVKEKIMDRYIKIKDYIVEKVDHFYNAHMKYKRTIGIHIRNTDRSNEPGHVSFQKIIDQANKYADDNTQFLIATDEEKLLDQAKKLLRGNVIAYESYRSKNGEPIHLSNKHGYNRAQLGEEALIEVLLLSKCNIFIHTISNFSYAALLFNPELENVLLV